MLANAYFRGKTGYFAPLPFSGQTSIKNRQITRKKIDRLVSVYYYLGYADTRQGKEITGPANSDPGDIISQIARLHEGAGIAAEVGRCRIGSRRRVA